MGFLHGVETFEITTGPRSVQGVRTAVIGLVGTAPIHLVEEGKVNDSFLVLNDRDAGRTCGPAVPGFTIPQALRAIFDQGRGTVIVINVFDPAEHREEVAGEAATFADLGGADQEIQLAHDQVIEATVKGDGETVYVVGQDYVLHRAEGRIERIAGGDIAEDAEVTVDYAYADPSKVTAADIIGGVDEAGDRYGARHLLDSYQRFGMFPKILIAPVYTTQLSVAAALDTLTPATACRAVALIDAPIGTTRDQALEGRGPQGAINFNFSTDRMVLCYPHLKVYDPATDAEVLEPYSQRLAGVIAATDGEFGYWYSPSNKPIRGVIGVERDLSAMINDPTSDVNALNAAGIVTVFNSFGSGLRSWGNRSSAFPASTAQTNFLQTRRTADMIHESLEYAMLQFMDLPLTAQLIDAIVETGNGFIRALIGRGALIDGSRVVYAPEKNPTAQLAAGHLVFDIIYIPPPPAERITFDAFIDRGLLEALR